MKVKSAVAGSAVLLFVLITGTLLAVEDPMFQGRPIFKEGSDRSYFVWNEGTSGTSVGPRWGKCSVFPAASSPKAAN